MRNSLVALSLLVPLWSATALQDADAAQEQDAVRVVEGLHSALIDAMRDSKAPDVAGRIGRLTPVVDTAFDFETIGRVVLGTNWRALDPEQRARFVDVFGDLSTATYAARFKGYDGESFKTLGVEAQRQKYQLVKTTLTKSDGEQITLNYLVRPTPAGWRIVNVIADGVSDLSLKRADYRAIIKSQGFDALLAKLASQIAAYRSGTSSS